MRKKLKCREYKCSTPPYLGGLCKEHHAERTERHRRRDAALTALETVTIEGSLPKNPELRDELLKIRGWWDRACSSVRSKRKDEVLWDEAEDAIGWCIALAQEIVDAEIAFRTGKQPSISLEGTRHWVWDRFNNLEAGLRSNGVKRRT